MVGWYHRLNGHGFEEAPGVGDGQGSLACCSPGHDLATELNWAGLGPLSLLSRVWELLGKALGHSNVDSVDWL